MLTKNPTEPRQPRSFIQASQVKALKPEAKPFEVRDVQSRHHKGLVLRVQPTGSKSWWFVYKKDGTRHRLPMGEYPATDVAAARKQAGSWRVMLRDAGLPDPHEFLEQRTREKAEREAREALEAEQGAWTVRRLSAAFLATLRAGGRRPRTLSELERHFDSYILPEIGDMAADAVTWADIEVVLEKAGQRKRGGDGQAARQRNAVRTTLISFYAWATGRRKRALPTSLPRHLRGLPNPVEVTQTVEVQASKRRPLTDDELRVVWNEIRAHADEAAYAALGLILLCDTRATETAEAQWQFVDLTAEHPTWTLPEATTKRRRDLVVYLSPQAVRLLEGLERGDGYVFVNPSAVDGRIRYERINRVLKQIVKDHDLAPVVSPNFLRHTLATYAEKVTRSSDVRRRMLNHRSSDTLQNAYVHDPHADAAKDTWAKWGRKLDGLLDPEDNAVEMASG